MTNIEIVQNDKGYELQFTLTDNNSNAVDLTGATLKFKAQNQEDSSLAVNGTMVIVSATSGTCYYSVASGDFDTAGNYFAEIETTFTDGSVLTFNDIVIKVLPELPL